MSFKAISAYLLIAVNKIKVLVWLSSNWPLFPCCVCEWIDFGIVWFKLPQDKLVHGNPLKGEWKKLQGSGS